MINEMPKIIPAINDKFVDLKLTKEIKKAFEADAWYKISDSIYTTPISKTESIYILIKDDIIVGGIQTIYKNILGKVLVEISLSKKYEKSEHGLLSTLLPVISKEEHKDIICGDEFTSDSIAVWLKFIKNPHKYNISEVSLIDISTNKQIIFSKNQIFGQDEKFKNKRIILKF